MTDDSAPLRLPVDPAEMIAAIGAQAQRLGLPSWPVFGLVDADSAGWLSGAAESQNGLRAVRIDYCSPGAGERLIVQTQPAAYRSPDLGRVLEQLQVSDDGGAPLAMFGDASHQLDAGSPSPNVEVIIDGDPASAIRRQDGSSTVCCANAQGDVIVLIAARGVPLEDLELQRIRDLGPLKQKRLSVIEQFLGTQPYPPPPYGR